MGESIKKPHAVCIPYPAQSHINTMLQFSKLLHHKGFQITFVLTEDNFRRILESRGPNSLEGSPEFKFEAIPYGLTWQLCTSISENGHDPFLQLLRDLNNQASIDECSSPVTCVISDCCMPFTQEACEELGLPCAYIWFVNAISAMCFMHYPHLKELGYSPLTDESCFKNGYLDQTIDWIPGLKSIRLRDIPNTIWTTDPKDAYLEDIIRLLPIITLKGSAVIINTFDTLEHEVLEKYSSMVDRLYTIGPIHLLLKQTQTEENHVETESFKSNLWKEDDSCMEWLNSKEKGTVAYVNFGSLTVMTKDQLIELAWGLANSKQSFLWIIRPDLLPEWVALPPEFLEETKDRGMILTWIKQDVVLNHPAIGVFLTHCGWNSILESLSAGVPLICWPFFSDQQTNCMCCCSEWGVGVEIDNNVDRVEVEKIVRMFLDGDKGNEMKKKALEWKEKAVEAIKPGVGSSYLNLDKLIQEVLLQPKSKYFA